MSGRRAQPRLHGVRREPVGSAFTPALKRAADREAARWGVTRSYVLANAAAFALGVDAPDYKTPRRGRR